MANNDERVMKAAQQYRAFWAEHPAVSIGLGFVPVLGQALGAIDALAAYGDPEASKLERGLATAGVIPVGKAIKHGRDFIIGKKGIANLRRQRAQVENAAGAGDDAALAAKATGTEPGSSIVGKELIDGQYMAEIMDDLTQMRNLEKIRVAEKAVDGTPLNGKVGTLGDFLPESGELFSAYPWMKDVPVVTRPKKGSAFGASFGSTSADPKTFQLNIDVPADGGNLDEEHIANVLVHELQHGMQRFEDLPSNMLGANSRAAGWIPYMANPGEIMARVTEQRKKWTPEQRRALSFRDHWKAELNRLSEGNTVYNDSFARLNKMEDPAEAAAQFQRYQMGVDKRYIDSLGGPVFKTPTADVKKGQFVRTLTPDEFGVVVPQGPVRQKAYLEAGTPNPYLKTMYEGREIDPLKITAEWDAGLKEWYVQDADGMARAIAAKKMYGADTGMPVIFNSRGVKPGDITDEMRNAPVRLQPGLSRKP